MKNLIFFTLALSLIFLPACQTRKKKELKTSQKDLDKGPKPTVIIVADEKSKDPEKQFEEIKRQAQALEDEARKKDLQVDVKVAKNYDEMEAQINSLPGGTELVIFPSDQERIAAENKGQEVTQTTDKTENEAKEQKENEENDTQIKSPEQEDSIPSDSAASELTTISAILGAVIGGGAIAYRARQRSQKRRTNHLNFNDKSRQQAQAPAPRPPTSQNKPGKRTVEPAKDVLNPKLENKLTEMSKQKLAAIQIQKLARGRQGRHVVAATRINQAPFVKKFQIKPLNKDFLLVNEPTKFYSKSNKEKIIFAYDFDANLTKEDPTAGTIWQRFDNYKLKKNLNMSQEVFAEVNTDAWRDLTAEDAKKIFKDTAKESILTTLEEALEKDQYIAIATANSDSPMIRAWLKYHLETKRKEEGKKVLPFGKIPIVAKGEVRAEDKNRHLEEIYGFFKDYGKIKELILIDDGVDNIQGVSSLQLEGVAVKALQTNKVSSFDDSLDREAAQQIKDKL